MTKVLVLVKRTSYRTFVMDRRDATVTALIENGDAAVSRMRRSYEAHEATLRDVMDALRDLRVDADVRLGPRTPIEETYDLVVTVGGDGTLLAASHHLGPKTPLLGINSAPETSVGFFCAATAHTARRVLGQALDGTIERTALARMRVDVNGECIHRRILNEMLFCHPSPAATSRYILAVTLPGGTTEEEEQRSSGLWIGPPAGSTAAQRSAGGVILPLTSGALQFVVREPYVRLGASLELRSGVVEDGGTITIRCKMREAKLFIDGHHTTHDVEIGDVITMRRSEEDLTVLGMSAR